jgi:dihydroorotase-like cyclic amidohydrolase
MRTLIRSGRVFDPASGEIADADIAIDGENVYQIGPGLDGDEEVDASGLTVLPGLVDTHVHVMLPYRPVRPAPGNRGSQRAARIP